MRPASPHVLFVCTGNLCRSPMAEVLLRARATDAGLPLTTSSRGTQARVGDEASAAAVRVCAELGIDLRAHRSAPVSAEDIASADHVFVMEHHHAGFVRDLFPEVGERLLLFGYLAGVEEIADPYGAWFDRTYRLTRDLLDRGVRAWIEAMHRPAPIR